MTETERIKELQDKVKELLSEVHCRYCPIALIKRLQYRKARRKNS